jgi:O-antigen ligase
MAGKASFFLTVVVAAFAPLPFGSNRPYWVALWCILLAVSLGCVDLKPVGQAQRRVLVAVLAVAVLGAGVLIVQSNIGFWPIPQNTVWGEAVNILGISPPRGATASVGAPWASLGQALAMLMAFLCSYLACLDPRRANALFKCLAYAGVAYALYGIFSLVLDPNTLLWAERTAYIGYLTGTFVNRNTAATYFGSCGILWLSWLLSEIKRYRRSGRAWADIRISTIEFWRPFGIPAVGFFTCILAVFLTASRAGTILTVAITVVTCALFLLETFPRGATAALSLAGLVTATAILLEAMGGLVALRIAHGGLFDESRWLVYRSSVAMIADHPWLGTGLGTFADVFPAYRLPELSDATVLDTAHNSWLECAVELGIPMTVALIALWAYVLVQLVRGSLSRRRGARFPVAATGVALLGSLHSLVDFSLQISGYAIVFAAVVGCGLAQSQSSASRIQRRSAPKGRRDYALESENYGSRVNTAPSLGQLAKAC